MDKKISYVRFFAKVNVKTINALIQVMEQKLKEGTERFVVLISSGGGHVASGISGHNFLKGIPAEVTTHNFGSVDSVALVLFCGGTRRLCVPHARFLLHGIGFEVNKPRRFDEKVLDEEMKGLKMHRENIGRIIADSCGKNVQEVDRDILAGVVLDSKEAVDYGLVHEVKSGLFPKGVGVIGITDS